MTTRGQKLVEMVLLNNKQEPTTSTQGNDHESDEEMEEPFSSGSSDLYQPSLESSTDEERNEEITEYEKTVDHVEESEAGVSGARVSTPKPVAKRRSKKADQTMWKRNIIKKQRLSGQAYTNRGGKKIAEKKPRVVDCSKCRFHCNENFSETERLNLCKQYWNLGDDKQQKIFLSSLISKSVCRRKTLATNQRNTSREFYLTTIRDERKRVCLKFFCATLAISHRVVELCMKKVSQTGLYTGSDGRSLKTTVYNATSEEQKAHVKAHIDSFPRVESHSCRKDSRKRYLAPELNLALIYRLYRDDYCQENNIRPVSLFVYRSIFNSYDPALSFYIPKKDQCTQCNAYQSAVDKTSLQEQWDNHKKQEAQAMKMKAEDKTLPIEDGGLTYSSITFDLQAVLSVPYSGDSQIYYKRKLNVYNFTIMDASKNDGLCYLWDECNGKKGSNEIGSCILKYIYGLPETVTHIASFSETCGGQNRNPFVTAAMLYAVNTKPNLQTIDLKFMESGHSYLECDSMHATIEREWKHQKVYTTEEWAVLISSARIKPGPYQVTVMSYKDFYDLKGLTADAVVNVAVNTSNEKVNWLNIKWIRLQKAKPFIIQYKYDLSASSFFEIDITQNQEKTRTQHKKIQVDWSSVNLKQLYNSKLPVTELKKKDLLALLKTKVIPEEYTHYIGAIPTASRINPDDDENDNSE